MKVSGLIQAGKVAAPTAGSESHAFDALPEAQNQAQTPTADVAVERMIAVDLLDYSPYQSRKKVDPIAVDQVGATLITAGQRTPITVRQKANGRYELLKGETRTRAAKDRGIPELRALVVVRDDRQAKLDVWLDNTSRPNTDYEHALMFREALDDGFASSQSGVAELWGCSQGKVSKCLSMLDLPKPILDELDKEPGLFGAKAAAVVQALWDQYPEHSELVIAGIRRLVEPGVEQNGLRAWVAQAVSNKVKSKTERTSTQRGRHHIPYPSGDACFVTLEKDRDIVTRLADPDLDMAEVRRAIEEALERLTQQKKDMKVN
jgi:ParB family transcriptional regulator, chromosome partitioning protein